MTPVECSSPGNPGAARGRRDAPRPAVERCHIGGTTWGVDSTWKERLLTAGGPDWFALAGDARAECLKRGEGRGTWRVRLGDITLVAKVFDAPGWFEAIRRRLSGTPAAREWSAAREALRRGVSVVCPIALGVRGRLRARSVVLSREIEGAATLAEAWQREVLSRPAPERHARACPLIECVARLLAAAHRAGVHHADVHPGNILVQPDFTDGFLALLADPYAIRCRRGAVPERLALRALAQLDHYFRRVATRAQRLRFWRRYRTRRSGSEVGCARWGEERRQLAAIATAEAHLSARLAAHRDRRLRRQGAYFGELRLPHGWRARVVLKLERRHRFAEIGVPDRTLADWQLILRRLPATVDAASEAGAPAGGVRVEVLRARSLTEPVAWWLAGSPHRRRFEACHRRRHRDEFEALILGYAEHRRAGLVDACALLLPDTEEAGKMSVATDAASRRPGSPES